MGPGRPLAAAGLAGLLLAGCAAPGVTGTGSAHVVLSGGRQVQYVSADVASLRVTITRSTTGQGYVRSFPGTALTPTSGGSRLSFSADNLAPGTYVATLEAFLDAQETVPVGRASSAPFGIAANVTTPVTLPSLVLAQTPVGDWRLNLAVQLSAGFAVTDVSTQLETPAGTAARGPSGAVLPATFTWGGVVAHPTGLGTSSVTVTATRKNGQRVTKTQVATASIVAATTVTSSLTFLFP